MAAAEDVRQAVRASRTATSAKAAASSAAYAAQSVCDNDNFANIAEAREAQTRFSTAQSQALHAAVVEHEAHAVKQRATLALAQDVQCWNVHRKREMLRSTLAYARSQREAARKGVAAWSSLRDGFIQLAATPSVSQTESTELRETKCQRSMDSLPEVKIYRNTDNASSDASLPAIIAVDHFALTSDTVDEADIPLSPVDVPTPIDDNHRTMIVPSEQPTDDTTAHDEHWGDAVQQDMTSSMQSLVDGLMHWGDECEETQPPCLLDPSPTEALGDY